VFFLSVFTKMKLSGAFLLILIIGSYGVNAQAKVQCKACVGFMEEFVNILLNAILNGEISSCAELCSKINNNLDVVICNVLCDYVGIKEFIAIIDHADPDPIYYCEELSSCTHTDGGAVTINATASTPTSGPVGTTFQIGIIYIVANTTSTGLLVIDVYPPGNGMPISDGELVEGQAPGVYKISWSLDTSPNSGNDYIPGSYVAVLGVCAGDCTNSHPWGGVYATANITFTITKG